MTENEVRAKVVSIAQGFYGCRESDGSHRRIIDIYNRNKPLPRGYPMTYTDAWCACFVSVVSIQSGFTDIMPKECGCGKMIELYKRLGRWQENDAYRPAPGDVIFYDWSDTGNGDNTSAPDHVGILVSVSGNTMKVIEGNMSNAVGYRNIAINGRYIRGFGLPDYASKASTTKPDSGTENAQNPGVAVGDIVDFGGAVHYVSANDTNAHACKPGKAKVTQISAGGKHPYHLIHEPGGGSTVYGWVDAVDIQQAAAPAPQITEGSTVRVKEGAKTYTGGGLASFVYDRDHTVKEISGDRAVITFGGVVVAAVKLADLTLV